MSQDSFSGWGIRTVAQGEARYNPMSYHNGSVWPHDNAMIAMGFSRYGLKGTRCASCAPCSTSQSTRTCARLPELFCGFIRRPRRGPTAYPVACSPQAWAAAAPFAVLGACLGIRLLDRENEVRFVDPIVPDFLDDVVLTDLQLGQSRLDLRLHRHGDDTTLNVLRRRGSARVALSK